MKKFLLLVSAFAIFHNAFAQTGYLSGSLKSQENKPIEAATVYLKKIKDSSLVKIALTDKAGLYEFENIKFGQYFLQAEAVGFLPANSNPIDLSETNNALKNNNLVAAVSTKELTVVSVTAKRPLIENRIDKTIVNVDASPTNTGLSALEADNDAQYTKFNGNSNTWDVDTSRSNRFIYKENINAAYININKQLKKWGLQVGLRAEQTVADGNQTIIRKIVVSWPEKGSGAFAFFLIFFPFLYQDKKGLRRI